MYCFCPALPHHSLFPWQDLLADCQGDKRTYFSKAGCVAGAEVWGIQVSHTMSLSIKSLQLKGGGKEYYYNNCIYLSHIYLSSVSWKEYNIIYSLYYIQYTHTQSWDHVMSIFVVGSVKNLWGWSSRCGSVVISLTGIHEDAGSIPGLTPWVGDPMLL